jgi:hypothetical protein
MHRYSCAAALAVSAAKTAPGRIVGDQVSALAGVQSFITTAIRTAGPQIAMMVTEAALFWSVTSVMQGVADLAVHRKALMQ